MGSFLRCFLLLALSAVFAWSADSGLRGLAMPEARVVAGASVAQITASPFGRFLLTQLPIPAADLNKMIEATGFDPRRDVREILFVTPGGAESKQWLLLARGNFNPAQISNLAKSSGVEITPYNGIDLFKSPDKTKPAVLAFADPTLAIVGDDASVRGAIGRLNNPSALEQSVAAGIAAVESQDIWFVCRVPATEYTPKGGGKGNNNPVNIPLQAITGASGGVRFGDIVQLTADLVARSAEDARGLADVFRFVTGMVQLSQDPKAAQFKALLAGLQITPSGNSVALAFSVPEAQLESLIQAAKARHPAHAGPPRPRRQTD